MLPVSNLELTQTIGSVQAQLFSLMSLMFQVHGSNIQLRALCLLNVGVVVVVVLLLLVILKWWLLVDVVVNISLASTWLPNWSRHV
ncbi:hypothetical protein CHH28_03845 [Bacterioplanes sanyensis]|uniref:Transmembrane protein n=1 Tax=Bacterioplanes sanyensis TaxID=1249553 RepID=A0A222FFS5_9GAMM|nr:hypothetical protein CHH28_03845 [Bacterioplanes sanyensis]